MLEIKLESIIACPVCKDKSVLKKKKNHYICSLCKTKYFSEDGIINLFHPENPNLKYVNIYEHYQEGVDENLEKADKIKVEEFKSILPDNNYKNYLDIGCGNGTILNYMSKHVKSKNNFGLELSVNKLKTTKKRNPKAFLIQADAENLPFHKQTLDLITIADVVEHVPNPSKLIKEAARVSKNVIIRIPIERNMEYSLVENPKKIFLKYMRKLLGIKIDEFEEHLHRFNRKEFVCLLRKNGLNVIKRNVFDNPFSGHYIDYAFPPPNNKDLFIIKRAHSNFDYYSTLFFRRFVFLFFKSKYSDTCRVAENLYAKSTYKEKK